jgi:hypothetical protein
MDTELMDEFEQWYLSVEFLRDTEWVEEFEQWYWNNWEQHDWNIERFLHRLSLACADGLSPRSAYLYARLAIRLEEEREKRLAKDGDVSTQLAEDF